MSLIPLVPWPVAGQLLLSLTAGTGSGVMAPADTSPGAVNTEMRNVAYHVDSSLILQIGYLRGRLVPTKSSGMPIFDDPNSFDIEMDTASITMSTAALSRLLNRYVFDYPHSPFRSLKVTTEKGRLKQSGHLHGLPFSITTTVSVTRGGELRLHPESVHMFGISVKGLMTLFGVDLDGMVAVRPGIGVRIEKNDLLLSPAKLLPPPRTRGTLVEAQVRQDRITLTFGRSDRATAPLPIPGPPGRNFMYFEGNSLRFGRLTMTPADLLVVDHDPRDPFDFWLAQYSRQLVAGTTKTTVRGGLITEWPDYYAIGGPRVSHVSR